MSDFYWDSFDCQIQCEEFYHDEEFFYRKPKSSDDLDWLDANEVPYIDIDNPVTAP